MLDALDIAINFAHPERKLHAERHRLRMDTMRTADAWRMLELRRTALQYIAEFMQIIQDEIRRIAHHDAERRILHIAGGQPLMDVFGILTDIFGHIRQESDDIVIRYLLDFMHALQIELCLLADVDSRFLRNLSQLSHGLAGRDLDLEHDFEFMLQRPEMPHFRVRIAFDHRCISSLIMPAMPVATKKDSNWHIDASF